MARKLKVGDLVKIVNCGEADDYSHIIFSVASDPWVNGNGRELVYIESREKRFYGGFATDCLELVEEVQTTPSAAVEQDQVPAAVQEILDRYEEDLKLAEMEKARIETVRIHQNAADWIELIAATKKILPDLMKPYLAEELNSQLNVCNGMNSLKLIIPGFVPIRVYVIWNAVDKTAWFDSDMVWFPLYPARVSKSHGCHIIWSQTDSSGSQDDGFPEKELPKALSKARDIYLQEYLPLIEKLTKANEPVYVPVE